MSSAEEDQVVENKGSWFVGPGVTNKGWSLFVESWRVSEVEVEVVVWGAWGVASVFFGFWFVGR